MSPQEHLDQPVTCQIIIQGKLDPKWSDWFAGLSIIHTNGQTVLEGVIADQSALLGVLVKIHDLGLSLISVNSVS